MDIICYYLKLTNTQRHGFCCTCIQAIQENKHIKCYNTDITLPANCNIGFDNKKNISCIVRLASKRV